MNGESEFSELIAQSAMRNGVQPAVLKALLELESKFADFTGYGSKAEFSRQIARIIDLAVGQTGA